MYKQKQGRQTRPQARGGVQEEQESGRRAKQRRKRHEGSRCIADYTRAYTRAPPREYRVLRGRGDRVTRQRVRGR